VRAVHDQRARVARRDRGGDQLGVERETEAGTSPTRTGVAPRGADQELVKEPGRREEDHFVAGSGDHAQAWQRIAAKPPLVMNTSSDSNSTPVRFAQRGADRRGRRAFVHFVGEPVFVLRFDVAFKRGHIRGQRHFVRITEHEVDDVGRPPAPARVAARRVPGKERR